MIARRDLLKHLKQTLKRSRVVALIGPRQCGKTTLARELVPSDAPGYFDLEDPVSQARLEEPITTLGNLKGLVIIDEIQRRPELFPVLRVLADRRPRVATFLVLGSASPDLLRQSSESLATFETITMSPFSLSELGVPAQSRHWLRGGFPPSFLARSETDSWVWRKNFIQTFLERDLPQWGLVAPAAALLRFWTMLAHYHAQTWNSVSLPDRLASASLPCGAIWNMLTGVLMIRQLQPWHANLKKRQIKAPRSYLRDTGLLHQLLGIHSERDLLNHPKYGASWEGYVIEEAIKAIEPDEAYFWATHNGGEIDLVLIKNGRMLGCLECKRADAPRLTPSMWIALEDLRLERIAVVYPGSKRYRLAKRVQAVPVDAIAGGLKELFSA